MDEINPEFERTDVALVIGANDVTNPDARSNQGSPIYGMPILDVDKAQNVIVLKRRMRPGFAGVDNPLYTLAEHADALRRRARVGRQARRRRQGALIPLFRARDVSRPPSRRSGRSRRCARGSSPTRAASGRCRRRSTCPRTRPGDFRAMPALGGGHALLKWVTSYPGNPARGLPTVTGVVLLSDASDGRLVAMLDAGAVTALRTGAAAVLAAETLGRPGTAAVDRRGRERQGRGADVRRARTGRAALGRRPGAGRGGGRGARRAASRRHGRRRSPPTGVVTVTPGNEVLLPEGSLRPGQHVSLMGADGPGQGRDRGRRARARPGLLRRLGAGVSHGGELAAAVAGRRDSSATT